jgi:hypothetical protein
LIQFQGYSSSKKKQIAMRKEHKRNKKECMEVVKTVLLNIFKCLAIIDAIMDTVRIEPDRTSGDVLEA